MNVTAIDVKDWDKDGTIVKVSNVTFDDGREVPGYDLPPGVEVGKPLPEGWEVATAKSGKLYIKVPKKGGGGFGGGQAAFRNTKEGQAIEQERMDRRTALMQAIAAIPSTANPEEAWQYVEVEGMVAVPRWEALALQMYGFLRQTAGGSSSTPFPPAGEGSSASSPSPSSSPEAHTEGKRVTNGSTHSTGDASQAGVGDGEAPASACTHPETSMLSPSGRPLASGRVRCLDCGLVLEGEIT